MRNFTCSALCAGLLCAAVSATPAAAQDDGGGWRFTIAPYVWLPGLDGDLTVRGRDADVDVTVCDVLENLDKINFAFMGHAEAAKGRFAVYLDGFYMEVEGDTRSPNASADIKSQQSALELVGAFRLAEFPLGERADGTSKVAVEVLGGARYVNLTTDLDLRILNATTSVSATKDWVDPLVGARVTWAINDRWVAILRGDIGGFDVGSDLTWNIVGVIGYRLNKNVALIGGYRWLDIDYADGSGASEFRYDVLMSGPFIGMVFEF